jgi:hypothetical protein
MFKISINIIFFKHIDILFVKIIPLILTFFIASCTVMTEKLINNMVLDSLKSISLDYKNLDLLIAVNISSQELFLLYKGNIKQVYSISTSAYGTGSEENSFRTPLGKHKISEKIGQGLPKGAILKARKWTGAIANIIKNPIDTEFDVVTSRILWLEGLEQGKNLGPGIDSKSRYIYIHGTAEEGLIGKPASDGCVRMYNDDVITLFEKVNLNTEVWII